MTNLNNLVKEVSGKRNLDIQRVDCDKGFKMIAHLEDEDGDGYRYNTYVSVHTEDTPWTRHELTNDKVEEAINNLADKVEEDRPDLTITEVEIVERTRVRDVEVQ